MPVELNRAKIASESMARRGAISSSRSLVKSVLSAELFVEEHRCDIVEGVCPDLRAGSWCSRKVALPAMLAMFKILSPSSRAQR
jgi:hypothetical protein